MVKYSVLSFIFIVFSCNCYQGNYNEFGRRREKFKFDNEEIYTESYLNLFDTTIVYKNTGYLYANKYWEAENNTYLKFYSNNKVGQYYDVKEINNNTFDPRNSTMGYCYQDKSGKYYIKLWAMGECNYMILKYLYLKKENNKIYLYDCLNSKKNSSSVKIFEPVFLSSDYIKNRKPDW
jgi:hypothetical protein